MQEGKKMLKSGKLWPYGIAIAIALVFSFCITTVMVTKNASIQKSDIYMTNYQDADARANDIIKARMDFDKKYNIKYISGGINVDATTIKYQITDKKFNPVNDAKISVLISRPDNSKFNIKLQNATVKNGIYTFKTVKLAKQGVWDIMAKVNVDKLERFYNLKADTRMKRTFEF